ncbi:MAG TPA: aminotransferase class V-fold PLP-dependent enzyme [Ktedonobacterales bacterium]
MADVTAEAMDAASSAPVAAAGAEYLLRPGVAFLNHGSFGACPRPVFDAYQHWQRELEGEPVEFLQRRLPALLADARARLGAFVGTDAANLVFVPNATYAINIIARSLELRPGDEVLGSDHEYGAVARTWRFNCARQGAIWRAQPIPLPITSAAEVVERFWAGVTPRTRVIVLSHITSPTALIFPIAEVVRRARERGILTVIDGAHAVGQLDLALDDLGADCYTSNAHKWLCSAKGSAFLYARPEAQALLRPLAVSWGWEAITPGPSRYQDYFEWTGTDDPAAYLSVPAAIAFQQRHDWSRVRAACHALAQEAARQVSALTGLAPIAPPEWSGQLTAIPLPRRADVAAADLQRRLFALDQVEVPITDWQDQRFVRVSIQAYNSPRDVARLVAALARAL